MAPGKQKGEGLAVWIATITGIAIGFGTAVAYVHTNFVSDNDVKSKIKDHVKDISHISNSNLAKAIDESVKTHTTQANHDNHNAGIPIPPGAVVAFNLEICPEGWDDYTPAYGRFIRGIDKSGDKIDPDGRREHGNTQEDSLKRHSHTVNGNSGYHKNGSDGSGEQENNTATVTTSVTGNSHETRPKNVALLHCEKVIRVK